MGDVICTLPVASALKAGDPESEIVWITDSRFAPLVERCHAVDQVVRAEKGISALREQIANLGEFDCALDMQGLLKSALPVSFARAKRKLGYHWQREGASLFSQAVRPDPSSVHVVDQYLDVARAAGGVAHRAEFALGPTADDLTKLSEKFQASGPLVVMNGGAGWKSKRWPAQHFARVSDQLIKAGATVVFIGGEDGREAYAEIRSYATVEPMELIGKTSLGELVALMDQCAMHLGGDTGSTHLAAALGKPAFAVHLLTRPERTCPYGQIHRSQSLDPEVVIESMLRQLSQ